MLVSAELAKEKLARELEIYAALHNPAWVQPLHSINHCIGLIRNTDLTDCQPQVSGEAAEIVAALRKLDPVRSPYKTAFTMENAARFIEELVGVIAPAPDQGSVRNATDMEARKDAAYLERNQVVAALAKCFPSGIAKTAIEGWSEDWHGCVYIDLPTGQASWHYHDSHAYLFAGLPSYQGKWDGHDTEEKYRRLRALPVDQRGMRERCARVADRFVEYKKTAPYDNLVHALTAKDIANAIRALPDQKD